MIAHWGEAILERLKGQYKSPLYNMFGDAFKLYVELQSVNDFQGQYQ